METTGLRLGIEETCGGHRIMEGIMYIIELVVLCLVRLGYWDKGRRIIFDRWMRREYNLKGAD